MFLFLLCISDYSQDSWYFVNFESECVLLFNISETMDFFMDFSMHFIQIH